MPSFSNEVIKELGWYVYRLIDPRNGHTFYVGKGKGNRVFAHAAHALKELELHEDELEYLSEKNQRILDIRGSGLEVQHVIHRHGIDSESTAFEIESALMEAYEGLSNIAGGHDNSERGCAHYTEIIKKYAAEILIPRHNLISFSCGTAIRERKSIYDACRFAWRVNQTRASDREYALAVDRGYVIGVFRIDKWLAATSQNFPGFSFPDSGSLECEAWSKRVGFVGERAKDDIQSLYLHTRLPSSEKGSQNPVRYFQP